MIRPLTLNLPLFTFSPAGFDLNLSLNLNLNLKYCFGYFIPFKCLQLRIHHLHISLLLSRCCFLLYYFCLCYWYCCCCFYCYLIINLLHLHLLSKDSWMRTSNSWKSYHLYYRHYLHHHDRHHDRHHDHQH